MYVPDETFYPRWPRGTRRVEQYALAAGVFPVLPDVFHAT